MLASGDIIMESGHKTHHHHHPGEAAEDNCINNYNGPSGLYYTLQMLRSLINMFTLQNISINLPPRMIGM